MKIGMTYIKGSLPGFETFGNLPTSIVKSNGLVNGVHASKELDGLIIPGGSIVESNSLTEDLAIEIKKIANEGKLIIGICSGFQAISKSTDIGRKSPVPIIKTGLNLLDATFSPMISNDKVEANVVNDSFLTNGVNDPIIGFHCHTYGKIATSEKEILYSHLKRTNYNNVDSSSVSGVINDNGNVIGTMIHGILDNNPKIVNNVFKFLDADEKDIKNIYEDNKKFKIAINKKLGIDSGIRIVKDEKFINKLNIHHKSENKIPPTLFIGSTSSDSGKTFITTGLAAALRKKGLNVAILKIGPDIRDTVPGLYLTNGLMEDYSSIKIGHLGWKDIEETLISLKNSYYDFVLIEGAMSLLIGILKDTIPYSGAEIAISSDIPILLVESVSKGGIESSSINLISYINFLKRLGVNINGAILNKVYDQDLFNKINNLIKKETNLNNLIAIPKIKLPDRGSTPEVEISLEDFSITALKTVEENINLENIVKIANRPKFKKYLAIEEINSLFGV